MDRKKELSLLMGFFVAGILPIFVLEISSCSQCASFFVNRSGGDIMNGSLDFNNFNITNVNFLYAYNITTHYLRVINTTVMLNETFVNRLYINNTDVSANGGSSVLGYRNSLTVEDILDRMQRSYFAATERTGFPNRVDSTFSFNEATRNLTIQPTGTHFIIYQNNTEYNKTSIEAIQITDVEGMHWIYYDAGVLTESVSPSISTQDQIIRQLVLITVIYWDAQNDIAVYVGEERHGMEMDGATHSTLHFTRGLQYISGLALDSILADQSGDLDSHAQFGVGSGIVQDEDLSISISSVTNTTGLPIYYRNGTSGYWRNITEPGFSVTTTGTGRLAWNEYTGTTWQLTEVGNLQFVLAHVFATTEKDNPMIAVMGQDTYNTLSSARAGANDEINTLLLGNLPTPEMKPVASIIFQTSNGYANAVQARIRTTDEGNDYIDFRFSDITSAGAIDSHSSLSDLSNDDHLQYLRTDGTRDLTGNWIISNNNITLVNGTLEANAGIITGGLEIYEDSTFGVIRSLVQNLIWIRSLGAGSVGFYIGEDNSHRGTVIWPKDTDVFELWSTSDINLKPSSYTADYFRVTGSSGNMEFDSIGGGLPVFDSDSNAWSFSEDNISTTGDIDCSELGLGGITSVARGKLGIDGTDNSVANGPGIELTTALNDYPLLQILPLTHDAVYMGFDAYHDGAGWKSGDNGSNFILNKFGNSMNVWGASSTVEGGALSLNTFLKLTSAGLLVINEDGLADADVRIEGDVDSDLVYVNAGTGQVGLKISTPAALLDLDPTGNELAFRIVCDQTTQQCMSITAQNLRLNYVMTFVGNNDASTGAVMLLREDGTGDLLQMAKESGGGNTVFRVNNSGSTIINGGNTAPTHELHVVGDVNVTGTIYYGGLTAQSPSLIRPLHDPYPITCTFASNGDFVVKFVRFMDPGYEEVIERVNPDSLEWAHRDCWEKNERFEYLDYLHELGTTITFQEFDDVLNMTRDYQRKPTINDVIFDWKDRKAKLK